MKRYLLLKSLILVIFSGFVIVHPLSAQDLPRQLQEDLTKLFFVNDPISGSQLPGLDCGVAGASNGIDKCCSNPTIKQETKLPWQDNPILSLIPNILDYVLSNTPIFGGLLVNPVKEYFKVGMERLNYLYELQKKYNITCIYGEPEQTENTCVCRMQGQNNNVDLNKAIANLCYRYLGKEARELKNCLNCAIVNSIYTGIGCIPLNTQKFITNFLLSIGIGLGGVVALMCIIYSAFMIQTSAGNPERLKKAQENLTSCILGLMMIIFSIFILRIIGFDILRIPFL